MRMPWGKSKADQLELLDAEADPSRGDDRQPAQHDRSVRSRRGSIRTATDNNGRPLFVPSDRLDEDPNNPRTEFPDAEIDELADDICERGILQPLVVHPADARGRYRLHFGAKRLRAALQAGLTDVPVVVRDAVADAYDKVAENQKRHALTPLDLARFIQGRVDAGESNAEIARRLGMNLTTVAHHLSLLDLPPVLDDAMKAGRCTSPRTLHELSKLHEQQPGQVKALVDGPGDITREAVATLRERVVPGADLPSTRLIAQAVAACDRLAKLLDRIDAPAPDAGSADLVALRAKIAALSSWSPRGSDGQTP